jgi:serine-type D-Ala-D-Ala carboxypeptidase (penicillin-binding protein 5/6)
MQIRTVRAVSPRAAPGTCLPAMRATVAMLMLAFALSGAALEVHAQSFQTSAPFALLMDFESGAVLFEKNADQLMAPASMSKLMTAEIVFHELKEGRLKLDDLC